MKRFPLFEVLALAVSIVAIGALSALQKQNAQPVVESYSTYDFDSGGYRGWFDLLEREHLRPSRFEERAGFLDNLTPALVVSDPPLTLNGVLDVAPRDSESLGAWARGGGTLVFVGQGTLAAFSREDLHLASEAAAGSRGRVPRWIVAPALARFGVRSVDAPSGARLQTRVKDEVLLSDGGGPIVVRYHLGRGVVYQVVDGTLFRNAGIAQPDRARLAFALAVLAAPHGAVAFDEAVHGYLAPEHWWQILPRRFVIALLFACAILAIAIAGAAIRLGPPRRLAPEPAPTSAEYLDAVAALTERARAAPASLTRARRSTRRMLTARFGLPDDSAEAAIAERIERPDLKAAFLELEELGRLPETKDASLVRGLALAYRLREEYGTHVASR